MWGILEKALQTPVGYSDAGASLQTIKGDERPRFCHRDLLLLRVRIWRTCLEECLYRGGRRLLFVGLGRSIFVRTAVILLMLALVEFSGVLPPMSQLVAFLGALVRRNFS